MDTSSFSEAKTWLNRAGEGASLRPGSCSLSENIYPATGPGFLRANACYMPLGTALRGRYQVSDVLSLLPFASSYRALDGTAANVQLYL